MTQKLYAQLGHCKLQQKKVKLDHVTIFTDRLKSTGVEVGNNDILPTLSSRNITSNEIYYHKISYINVRTQYRDTLQKRA